MTKDVDTIWFGVREGMLLVGAEELTGFPWVGAADDTKDDDGAVPAEPNTQQCRGPSRTPRTWSPEELYLKRSVHVLRAKTSRWYKYYSDLPAEAFINAPAVIEPNPAAGKRRHATATGCIMCCAEDRDLERGKASAVSSVGVQIPHVLLRQG